ncbi:MAG: hypothetical protein H0W89_01290 [Candidatus Levybacteria bacterium]|nr:hypothetical protein [Candidatus Levybacteria bacterium]
MRTIRVYKDNLREHIFRTMFFTDTVIFFMGGLAIALSVFMFYKFVLNINHVGLVISTIFLLELFYALVATLKIDHQPLYKVIPRAVNFSFSKKHFSMNELTKTTGDFKIVGNYIIRKKKLIAVYEIRPFDIALLNNEERDRYYHHIKTMLHTLPMRVQLISRKETAKVEDYHEHFYSLYETANEKVNWLMENYIKEISSLIEDNNFQLMKYYAVFSTPLLGNSDRNFTEAAQKLEDMERRFSSGLALERIQTLQLKDKQLVAYFQSQFRNNL